MRFCSLFFALGLTAASCYPQTAGWQPSPGHTQLPIWPAAIPDAAPVPPSPDTAPPFRTKVAGASKLP